MAISYNLGSFFSLLATALFPSVRFFRCSLSQSVSEVRAKTFSLGVCPTINHKEHFEMA